MELKPRFRTLADVVLALFAGALLAGSARAAEVEIIPDVVYGHKDGLAMTMDVIKPKANANGAAVLYMVSGGWVSAWTPPVQTATRFQALLDRGFTVIAVRHGSSPKYFIPEIVLDVRRAVRFVRFNAKQWNIDADRLGVHGGSAGGHLSFFVTKDDPPALLIHGDADMLVNISHSQRMFKALQDSGVKSEFITLPGAGHGFRGEDSVKANAAMVQWFEQTLAKQ